MSDVHGTKPILKPLVFDSIQMGHSYHSDAWLAA